MINLTKFSSYCEDRAKIIISRDARSSCRHIAINNNRNQVRQYRIDGEVISDVKICKCDFLVLNIDKKTAYFIELKGSSIHKAIDQIENTLNLLKQSLQNYEYYLRIIYRSGTHQVKDDRAINWRMKYPQKAIISNMEYTDDI